MFGLARLTEHRLIKHKYRDYIVLNPVLVCFTSCPSWFILSSRISLKFILLLCISIFSKRGPDSSNHTFNQTDLGWQITWVWYKHIVTKLEELHLRYTFIKFWVNCTEIWYICLPIRRQAIVWTNDDILLIIHFPCYAFPLYPFHDMEALKATRGL